MQVPTNRFYDAAARSMGRLSSRAEALQVQIATGKRLQAPSDDALAFRRLEGLRQAEADATAFGTNLKLAEAVLRQSDTILSEVSEQLQRAAELTNRAATGTLSESDRKLVAIELADISEALFDLANATDPRGQPLFGGIDGANAAVRQPDGSIVLAATAPSSIPIAEGQSIQASEAAARVFNFTTKNGVATDTLSVVAALAESLAAGNEVGNGVDDIKRALDQTFAAQASLGARAARIDMLNAQATATAINREETRSGLEDADITATVTELQKTMTILQATQASFAKLSSLSLFDYLR